jgi:hypothetical protein
LEKKKDIRYLKRSTPRHITIKLLETGDKGKSLKSGQWRKRLNIYRSKILISCQKQCKKSEISYNAEKCMYEMIPIA